VSRWGHGVTTVRLAQAFPHDEETIHKKPEGISYHIAVASGQTTANSNKVLPPEWYSRGRGFDSLRLHRLETAVHHLTSFVPSSS